MRICEKFPGSRRPSEKISQTAIRVVRGRLLDPVPPPPPGEMGSRTPDPRPAAVRECKRVGPNCHQTSPPFWPYARHTFCNSGKLRFFGGGVPAPLRILDPLWGGPMGPPATAHAWKKICEQGYAWHTFRNAKITSKNSDCFPPCQSALRHKVIFQLFSIMPKWCLAYKNCEVFHSEKSVKFFHFFVGI